MHSSEIVLIDTSAWICFFARKGFEAIKKSIANLLDENRAAITGPILTEMIQGCRTEGEKRNLREMFEGVYRLPISDGLWDAAADLSYNLRRNGITSSVVDALIATVAISYNIPLLHHDRDYDFIGKRSKLRIYHLEMRPQIF